MAEKSSRPESREQKVRTRRLFVIDEAIRTKKYPNTDKLAAIAEVNSRTIQQDIEYLRDMFNTPIEYSVANRGYHYTKSNHYVKSVSLTEGICQKGNWYIIGFCHDKKEPRFFSLSHMKNAVLTKKSFVVPAGFKAGAYFDKEIGVWASSRTPLTVELEITGKIGPCALERQWHNTQQIEQREDGSVYVKFTTTQMAEVLRWVLGQGHTVKVPGPPELVVKAEAERVRRMYA
jgi:predicted DNA-binding transcriptional regulator YafY